MENQKAFDDEGCMSTPLLDTSRHTLYASYRKSYAQLLYFWKCPLARLEVLKFNGLKDYFNEIDIPDNKSLAASIMSNETRHASQVGSPPSPPLILGKKDSLIPIQSLAEQGLDVTGYCLKHESRLEPLPNNTLGGATGRCDRCKFTQRQLRCTICAQPLTANFIPCLSCGCATHSACLSEHHSSGNTNCPGGCDCDCGLKASEGAVESWEVMMGAIERMRALDAQRNQHHGKGKQKQTLEEWDEPVKDNWDSPAVAGLGRGNLNLMLGRKMGREWSMGMVASGKKKASSLRNEALS